MKCSVFRKKLAGRNVHGFIWTVGIPLTKEKDPTELHSRKKAPEKPGSCPFWGEIQKGSWNLEKIDPHFGGKIQKNTQK